MKDSKEAEQVPDERTSSPRIWRNGVGCVDCGVFGNGQQQMEENVKRENTQVDATYW